MGGWGWGWGSKIGVGVCGNIFISFEIMARQQYLIKMSYIIDNSKQQYFYHFLKKKRNAATKSDGCHSLKEQNRHSGLTRAIEEGLKLAQLAFHTRETTFGAREVMVEQYELGKPLIGLLSFEVASVREEVNIKFDILSNNQLYYRIQSPEHCKLLNRALVFSKSSPASKLFKTNININKGTIRLSLPLYYLFEIYKLKKSTTLKRKTILQRLINQILHEAKLVVDWLLKRGRRDDPANYRHAKATSELGRLRQMMNIFKKVSQGSEVMTEKSIRQYKLKQMQSVKDLMSNKILLSQALIRPLAGYQLIKQEGQLRSEEECVFNSYQQDSIKKFTIPSRKNHLNQPQLSTLLTHIYINKPEQMRLKPLVTGGFSSVFLAEVEFSFVDPSRFREEQFLAVKDRKWERNLLVVKREISSGGGAAKRGSRNQHEKDIIDHMKNSVSCMLNRYYFPVNTTELCKNDILMDYIPFPTLKEFLVMSRATLSLQSKLTVMVSIVQGLRSIDRHDVAHLDLKPNNIVLNPDLQIKLLDFGQSFHQDVEKCKPGFTMPYGCPEVHSAAQNFSIKSDIYSLGVLLFEVLYRQVPLYFFLDNNLQKYKTEEYLQHWLYVPEQCLNLGEKSVYLSLNLLISRCLERDPSRRPELLTIGLILLQCIKVLQG